MEISGDRIIIGNVDNVTATAERESDGAPWTIVLHRHHSREEIVLNLGDVGLLVELAERHGWRRAVPPPRAEPPSPAAPAPPEGRDVRQWRAIGHDDPRKALFGAGAREGRGAGK